MATVVWQGGATAKAGVTTWTLSVTWIAAETITFTYGTRTYVYTIASTVIATILTALAAALNALSSDDYPEIAECTWTCTATTLVATCDTAGRPSGFTISTNSAAGLINGAASSTGTATITSSGPNSWSTAANWSTATVPATGDSVILGLEDGEILYDLAQSGVTLASLRLVAKQFTLGLPETNADGGYPEYRQTSLFIGATLAYVNSPQSQRIKINFHTVQTACTIDATGSGEERDVPACLIRGTHASNAYIFNAGSIGRGFFGSVAWTALTTIIGAKATVIDGAGGTPATITMNGGSLTSYCAISTELFLPTTAAAKFTHYGSGAINQITMLGGTVSLRGNGTIGGDTVVGGSGFLTFDGGSGPIQVTNPISLESSQARFSDATGRITDASAVVGYTLLAINCAFGSLGIRPDSAIVVSPL